MPDDPVYVFDACAVVAMLQKEPGAEIVAGLLKKTENRCLLHAINACEVYYDLFRRDGEEDASALEEILATIGLELVETLPADLWRTAGKLKAQWRRVSLADCLAIGLAVQRGGTLVTSDHHELDPIAQEEVCPVLFIR